MKFKSAMIAGVLLTSLAGHGMAAASPAAAPRAQSAGSTAVRLGEYEAINHVLGLYIEAGRQGKSAIMKPAFHPQAMVYGGPGEKVDGRPISALFDFVDGRPAAGLKAQIVKIEVQDQTAFARVETDNWHGARYSDMFLLVKDSGRWKILTKVFHAYDNN